MVLSSELKNMKRVLRRMEYINREDVVDTRGRIACEVSAGDELMITELLISGIFNKMEPEVIAAILSSLVHSESKGEEKPSKHAELNEGFEMIKSTAERVAKILAECKVGIKEEEYVEKFKPDMMDVTYEWCKGRSFLDVCKLTDIFEGTINRVFKRLEELLRQLELIAKNKMDNLELSTKIGASIEKLKRGIPFSGSLYL